MSGFFFLINMLFLFCLVLLEMGLGKVCFGNEPFDGLISSLKLHAILSFYPQTCQTIAFLCWLKHNQGLKNVDQKNVNPHLVIAPASVVSNWVLEFQKFAPHLNVVKYHGSMNERTELQSRLKPYLANRTKSLNGNSSALNSLLAPLDVIIAPVTYFQQEKSDDRHFLKKFTYEYLIVDEAHLLKNSRGMRYKSLDRFKTSHRLLLTVCINLFVFLVSFSLHSSQSVSFSTND